MMLSRRAHLLGVTFLFFRDRTRGKIRTYLKKNHAYRGYPRCGHYLWRLFVFVFFRALNRVTAVVFTYFTMDLCVFWLKPCAASGGD